MFQKKARAHYLGKGGLGRLNCAQAVVAAFGEILYCDGLLTECADYANGNAPGGLCGSIYAAHRILQKHNPEAASRALSDFETAAGSLHCKNIRTKRCISCVECVAKAAEIVQNANKNDR